MPGGKAGQPYRLFYGHEVYYDLKAQRYLVSGLDNQRNPYRFSEQADPREFSPNALTFYIR